MTHSGLIHLDLATSPELADLRSHTYRPGIASARTLVAFDPPFNTVPDVIVAISGVNIRSDNAMHLKVEAVEIMATGFIACLSVSNSDFTDSVNISWLAIGD